MSNSPHDSLLDFTSSCLLQETWAETWKRPSSEKQLRCQSVMDRWRCRGRGLLVPGGATYRRHADLSAGIQEVFHIPATLGHAELGLQETHGHKEKRTITHFVSPTQQQIINKTLFYLGNLSQLKHTNWHQTFAVSCCYWADEDLHPIICDIKHFWAFELTQCLLQRGITQFKAPGVTCCGLLPWRWFLGLLAYVNESLSASPPSRSPRGGASWI